MATCLDTLIELAGKHRLACITYRKLSELEMTRRTVEPYRLLDHGDALYVQCWQVDPCCDEPSWRTFRCDGIIEVEDGGEEFEPRRAISMIAGEVNSLMEQQVEGKLRRKKSEGDYRDAFIDAIRDRRLNDREKTRLENMCEKISTAQRKVVHAQVFQEVLFDVLLDHKISDEEDEFLSEVRSFMNECGWAP